MRLAGTCSRYSNRAIPQLTRAATYQARDRRSFRCAYHAKVMNTFEHVSKLAVVNITRKSGTSIQASANSCQLSAFSFQLSAFSFQLGYWLLYWLPATGDWRLATDYQLSAV